MKPIGCLSGQENLNHFSNGSSTNRAWNQRRIRNKNEFSEDSQKYVTNNNNYYYYQLNNKNSYSKHCYSNLPVSRSEYQRMDNFYNRHFAEHIKNDNISNWNTYYKRTSHKHFSEFTIHSFNEEKEASTTSDGTGPGHTNIKRRPYHELSSSSNYKNKNYNRNQSHGVLTNYNRKFVRSHCRSSSILESANEPTVNDMEDAQLSTDNSEKSQDKENKQSIQPQHYFNEGKLYSNSHTHSKIGIDP